MVVFTSAATKVEVGSMTKRADIKHVTMLNGATIETRIGIRIQGAEGAGWISAVQSLADILGTIVMDVDTVGANRSFAPRAVESYVLRAVNVIHVGGDYVGGLIHAVIVDVLFVAGNKANCGNKKGNCYQT